MYLTPDDVTVEVRRYCQPPARSCVSHEQLMCTPEEYEVLRERVFAKGRPKRCLRCGGRPVAAVLCWEE